MVNPAASEQAKNDCIAVAGMGLNSKILTHTRCHMNDVKIACDTGVDGVNVYMATSALLSKHSHGKGIDVCCLDALACVTHSCFCGGGCVVLMMALGQRQGREASPEHSRH